MTQAMATQGGPAVNGTLRKDGESTPATREMLQKALREREYFWLDLDGIDDEVTDMLIHDFGIHHLAVEDAEAFDQRPKLFDYGGFMALVLHGLVPDGQSTIEVHVLFSKDFVVTVHRGDCGPIDQVRERLGRHRASEVAQPHLALVYLIVDALVDSYFPVLSDLDQTIDELEDSILVRPNQEQMASIFAMKRQLTMMRKVVTPERDMLASLAAGVVRIPGMTREGERYFRDAYDHVIRIADLIESYRDLLSGVMDTHLSTTSNRLNIIMKQLTIVSTVFLPLTFLTGFFGQNFNWMEDRIGSLARFLALGIGLELLGVVVLMFVFKRRGWLQGSP